MKYNVLSGHRGVRLAVGVVAAALLGAAIVAASDVLARDDGWVVVVDKGHGPRLGRVIGDRPFLGVTMQELTEEVKEGLGVDVKQGVLISDVIEGSPAEEAGIEEGDVVVEFAGKKVDSPSALQDLVLEQEEGDEVTIKLVRDGKTRTVKVTIGESDDFMTWIAPEGMEFDFSNLPYAAQWFGGPRLGVRISDMDEDLASYFGVKEGEGVLVLGIDEDSSAEGAGIKSGDVIVEVEGDKIESAGDIREALEDKEKGDEFTVTVVRKKKRQELNGTIKEGGLRWYQSHARRGAPDVQFYRQHSDELRKELDELRKEVDELKKELKKSRRQ